MFIRSSAASTGRSTHRSKAATTANSDSLLFSPGALRPLAPNSFWEGSGGSSPAHLTFSVQSDHRKWCATPKAMRYGRPSSSSICHGNALNQKAGAGLPQPLRESLYRRNTALIFGQRTGFQSPFGGALGLRGHLSVIGGAVVERLKRGSAQEICWPGLPGCSARQPVMMGEFLSTSSPGFHH